MNKQIKTILWIIGILIVLTIGVLAYMFFNPLCCGVTGNVILQDGFNESNYCEVQTINGTAVCLPEGVCEFQENSEGRKICLAKRV